jgi:hypothetical protein
MEKMLSSLWSSLAFILIMLCCVACHTSPKVESEILKAGNATVAFLDSIRATNRITRDDKERFFDHVQLLDMTIQMKKAYLDTIIPRSAFLSDYQQSLREQLSSFTMKEKELLRVVFEQVDRYLQPFSQFHLPDSIMLLKVKGDHYGASTYYTRENTIVIPQPELDKKKVSNLTWVMLHELFHIYSRYNPEARQSLYELIGFNRLTDTIRVSDSLVQRLLLNPDGIDWRYTIQLKNEFGDPILAIPLIVAASDQYTTGLPDYFDYIDFQLYPLEREGSAYRVAQSPLPAVDQLPDFFEQIGDNTNYIIHPDEILADNFVLLALALSGDKKYVINNYSKRGQEILEGVGEVVK